MAIDFSRASQAALDHAIPLAQSFGGTISLLHVISPPAYPMEMGHVPVDLAVMEQSTLEAAEKKLRSWAAKLPPDLQGDVLVRSGLPGDVITAVARKQRSDWIVIATQGRTGLQRLLLGSTAEHVVRHASCPVLVTRRSKRAARG